MNRIVGFLLRSQTLLKLRHGKACYVIRYVIKNPRLISQIFLKSISFQS